MNSGRILENIYHDLMVRNEDNQKRIWELELSLKKKENDLQVEKSEVAVCSEKELGAAFELKRREVVDFLKTRTSNGKDNKIQHIRFVRAMLEIGLKKAKYMVDGYWPAEANKTLDPEERQDSREEEGSNLEPCEIANCKVCAE